MAPLKAEILELDENAWQFYREDEEAVLDCAVVPYYPEEKGDRYREPLRYVAVRVSKKQRRVVRRRGGGQVLCGGDESVGLGSAAVAGVASREGGFD